MKSFPVDGFARRLRREWRLLNLPVKNQTALIAVSGGADSSALLAAINELQRTKKLELNFVVAHFNHRLRETESDSDARFVEDLAKRFNFDFVCGFPEYKLKSSKSNLEQTARVGRYDFLQKTAEERKAFAVFTAHTLNDQAETFLLRLLRGSGSDGLGAIKRIRNLNLNAEILLVRPLLSWATRDLTEEFCRKSDISFRHDRMNVDLNFSRVRVRHELIPLLKTFNPNIVETLSETADLLRADADELNFNAQDIYRESCAEDAGLILNTENLKKISGSLRLRVLRLWLEKNRGSLLRIDKKHLIAIENLLINGQGNSYVELPLGGIVMKKGKFMIFEEKKVEKRVNDI